MSTLIDFIIEILLTQAEGYQDVGLIVCKKTNIITVTGCSPKKIQTQPEEETKDPETETRSPKDLLNTKGAKFSQDEHSLQFEIADLLLETAKEYEDLGIKVNRSQRTISFDDHQLGLKLVDQQIHFIKSEI